MELRLAEQRLSKRALLASKLMVASRASSQCGTCLLSHLGSGDAWLSTLTDATIGNYSKMIKG